MLTANVSQKSSIHSRFAMLSLLYLVLLMVLSACAGPAAENGITPIVTTPASGDAFFIPVSAKPEIIVKGENAAQLTFVSPAAQQNISTASFSLPYKKEGNKVTIDFGATIVQNLTIKIPPDSNLSVILTNGNIVVDTFQGQIATTLTSGTVHIKNFTPSGTNTFNTKNGTIDVTFGTKASCSLKAQTSFGAIVSGYTAIREKRSDMKDEAEGTIGGGAGATVNLTAGYGSITIGSV